jgi:hypothetical protein
MAATMAPAPRGKTNVHDVRITVKDMYIILLTKNALSIPSVLKTHPRTVPTTEGSSKHLC